MSEDEATLENRLMLLGREELHIEQKLKSLRQAASDAVQRRDLHEADQICDVYEKLKAMLPPLQSEILKVERALYGMRRKKSV